MDGIKIKKYLKLNFNLKNIIFSHLPLIQILIQIIKIDKSTLMALRKNPFIIYIKNKHKKFQSIISIFNCESINYIKDICFCDSSLTENNIDEIIVFLLVKNFSCMLDLRVKNLGTNEKNMMYLIEALKINTSIKTLDLCENYLGRNEKFMMYLSKGMKINFSIEILKLGSNELGTNEINIMYLSEGLKSNTSIKELNVSLNNLGINEKNMMYLSEALKINNLPFKSQNIKNYLVFL